jgi:hypothetical protein
LRCNKRKRTLSGKRRPNVAYRKSKRNKRFRNGGIKRAGRSWRKRARQLDVRTWEGKGVGAGRDEIEGETARAGRGAGGVVLVRVEVG